MKAHLNLKIVFGKVCSGKDTYVKSECSNNCLHIDIGRIVRQLTKTEERKHLKELDSLILDEIEKEFCYWEQKVNVNGIVITGIRQLTVLKGIEKILSKKQLQINNEFILLNVPESILKARYEKRAATKDHSISFEDTIKRDDLLGLSELIEYLYTVNTTIIQNYNHNEIDTLQEK